jgi:predicted ATPase
MAANFAKLLGLMRGTVSGEAGIGKSRLTAALLEHIADEPHTRLRYFCSPQHTDSAFYPIIGQMERAAGLAQDDTSQARLDKLDAVLAQTATATQDAALFAEMLSLPNDGRYPALDLVPQQRRQRTLEALINRLGQRETAAIIAGLVGNKELPADVMAEIVERTDGIPLFVEEMTKAVLEAESEGEARHTAAAVPSPALAVPASLHASLMARLDRLGPAKEVAQVGAVIGRECERALYPPHLWASNFPQF